MALCAALHLCVECYRHATNAEFFENRLLQAIPWGEGYTVILDNARFHRRDALRRLARGKVRLLFLPAYSPDYNSGSEQNFVAFKEDACLYVPLQASCALFWGSCNKFCP